MKEQDFNIEGTINTSKWKTRSSWNRNFQEELEFFKASLIEQVKNQESKTYYKFSDGEYLFYSGKFGGGSVKAGRRDISEVLSDEEMLPFREGIFKNDFNMSWIAPNMVDMNEKFIQIFKKDFDWPVEFVYGLIANKWFFKQFKGEIGLIGAGPKLELIQELLKRQEYRDYLGIDQFEDYIKVPQKYICNNLEETDMSIKKQLEKSKSKIFLIGIGHSQQALLHRMKNYKDAIYIVCGAGICALAGVQDNNRPYFGDWTNYKLKNYNYQKIDIWRNNFKRYKIIG